MVWNIQFQFAALMLAIVIAGMCLGQKRLNFAAERAFTKLLLLVIFSIITDILSVFAINYRGIIGPNACEFACKLYLLSISLVGCQAAWFAVAEIRYTFSKFWVYMTVAPVVVAFASLLLFPLNIYVDQKSIYTYGIPVVVTYVMCALYIVSTTVMVIVLRHRINAKRRFAIYFWMICWASVATLQFFNNEILMVSFSMALACMYMYCKLENPEYHLDFATNLFNKKGFSMIMSEHLKYHEKRSLVTFTVGDINMISEVFGSHVVEKLILSISEFADGIPNSTLFRIDENIFCLSIADFSEREKVIEQLIKRFEEPWLVRDVSIETEVSISAIDDISVFPDVESLEEVVSYFALESKKLNFGTVLFVNEDELKRRQRFFELQSSLEWALKNDGVEVYFQPIYNIGEGRFSAVEALARVRDSKGNIIMPGEFIEYAEKNGMILKLGEMVFRKTCDFYTRYHADTYGIDYVEVNLSVVQCMQEDLAKTLKNIMGEYQIPPYRVNFEITETAAVNSKRNLEVNMKELIEYGCGFSLDDYGSGYSNLSYVVNLPLRIIKIDKMMVDSFFSSEKVRTATEYTINMIHNLGMKIVVEGIETEEQYLAFKKLNVEYIQGFYFSKPIPQDKVLSYIQEWL